MIVTVFIASKILLVVAKEGLAGGVAIGNEASEQVKESLATIANAQLAGILLPSLSVVEVLESVMSANLQRATRLRQSILKKAFTGELT